MIKPHIATALVALPLVAAAAANAGESEIETARAALEQWVETQRVISKEERDLALAKEMLNERIELVRRETEAVRAKIAEAEAAIAETDAKRERAARDNQLLLDSVSTLDGALAEFEQGVLQLLRRVPPPLRERVKPLSQRIGDTTATAKRSISERFQNVVGILNEINKANREITVVSEVRPLADGTSAEVTAIYFGIGQGYYSGANGTLGGVGTAGEDEWVWRETNEDAAAIAQLIAVWKGEQLAAYVQVPVEVK